MPPEDSQAGSCDQTGSQPDTTSARLDKGLSQEMADVKSTHCAQA